MDEPEREVLLQRLWPWLMRLTVALALVNLVIALVVRLWGPSLHPAFVDSHTWLLFLVTGLSLGAQAFMMRYVRCVLGEPGGRDGGASANHVRLRRRWRRSLLGERHAACHRRVARSTGACWRGDDGELQVAAMV
jgi:hypothetical protein